jgi:hypothetical protein
MGKGKLNGKDTPENDRRWYYFLAVFAQIPAIVAIVLILILFGKYRGGFGWGVSLFSFSIFFFRFFFEANY